MRKFLLVTPSKLKNLLSKQNGYCFNVNGLEYRVMSLDMVAGQLVVSNGVIDDIQVVVYSKLYGVYC